MQFLENYLLSLMMAAPVIGALFILMIRNPDKDVEKRNIRQVALLTTIVTFILSIFLWVGFDNSTAEFQFVEKYRWIGDSISYYVGVEWNFDAVHRFDRIPYADCYPFELGSC